MQKIKHFFQIFRLNQKYFWIEHLDTIFLVNNPATDLGSFGGSRIYAFLAWPSIILPGILISNFSIRTVASSVSVCLSIGFLNCKSLILALLVKIKHKISKLTFWS